MLLIVLLIGHGPNLDSVAQSKRSAQYVEQYLHVSTECINMPLEKVQFVEKSYVFLEIALDVFWIMEQGP